MSRSGKIDYYFREVREQMDRDRPTRPTNPPDDAPPADTPPTQPKPQDDEPEPTQPPPPGTPVGPGRSGGG